jgi:hypothetical protein
MKALNNLKKKHQQNQDSLLTKTINLPENSPDDRRSGQDRRKTYRAIYFLKGGIERRTWKERRYVWNMTM